MTYMTNCLVYIGMLESYVLFAIRWLKISLACQIFTMCDRHLILIKFYKCVQGMLKIRKIITSRWDGLGCKEYKVKLRKSTV